MIVPKMSWTLATCLLLNAGIALATPRCDESIRILKSSVNTLTADAAVTTRTLEPSFFGFNLEWLEFQSSLWDAKNQRVAAGISTIFKDFPGAIYRYPGGTNSNHFEWQDAVGDRNARQLRRHVSWTGPVRAEFGLDEYLQFVKDVGGRAWYVANLYGNFDNIKPISELAASAGRLATATSQRSAQGMPEIFRWELGNELDRGTLKWSPGRIGDSALQVGAAIKKNEPSAKFVVLQQEYPAQAEKAFTAAKYNKELRMATRAIEPEYAMHFYYDGPPDAPPVDYFLKQLCQVVDNTTAEGGKPQIWITEHGRVPNGFWTKTPKEMWPETANLTAAVSMADLLIALTQIPEARGAFAHSLVTTTSPWPLVHKRVNDTIDPAVTLIGLKLLRQSLIDDVLVINQSVDSDGQQGANYSVRSTVLSNSERTAFTVWSVNKTSIPQKIQFRLKNARNEIKFENANSISDEQTNASNYASPTRIAVSTNSATVIPNGERAWTIQLPPNSVNSLRFGIRR